MPIYCDPSELSVLEQQYQALPKQEPPLQLWQGNLSPEQLDLYSSFSDIEGPYDACGHDCRGYLGIHAEGLPEARAYFAGLLGVEQEEVLVLGNSSMEIFFQVCANALMRGVPDAAKPWPSYAHFVCPVPGYFRHFYALQYLGIRMHQIPLGKVGPNMSEVESIVQFDKRYTGIVITPLCSNPTGIDYSDAIIKRICCMKTANLDFRIFADLAYAQHHLGTPRKKQLPNMLELCRDAGVPDRPMLFFSTSKITHPQNGVAVLVSSKKNLEWFMKMQQAIKCGPPLMEQLRQVRYLRKEGIGVVMHKHATILAPKFEAVCQAFREEFTATDIASWSEPRGYFICLFLRHPVAHEAVEYAVQKGYIFADPREMYPNKDDIKNNIIRIAPSSQSAEVNYKSVKVLALCVKLASAQYQPEPKF
ncbi:MAG: transcriptional regulator [Parcubacteria group bacterium Gr01-1014_70]|nr:MAG: transcriptional regulator [Parcubacteria group bacterium Gr01-1014_70]